MDSFLLTDNKKDCVHLAIRRGITDSVRWFTCIYCMFTMYGALFSVLPHSSLLGGPGVRVWNTNNKDGLVNGKESEKDGEKSRGCILSKLANVFLYQVFFR